MSLENAMTRASRRTFLKWAGLSGAGLLWRPRFLGPSPGPHRALFLDQIGVCTTLANRGIPEAAGCSYIEESVRSFLMPEQPEEKFQAILRAVKDSKIPVRACNGFLPGSLKAVGPETKHPEILEYAGTAFRRAAQAGIGTIVWGSGESRKIPDGFSRTQAEEQFINLAKQVAALAKRYRVLICLEPLNRAEVNFINSLGEGSAIVEAVGHPSFKLLADIYHLLREGETPEAIEAHGIHIRHCHIAEKEQRTPPGTAGDNFKPFLRALRKIDYRGGISIECRWQSMEEQLPAAVAYLKKQIAEVSES
jgi:sugar phosphate isomerase/epimerase